MGHKKITYTREELYEQVWSEAMIRLAPKYGLSDNGLRKICKKLNIPFVDPLSANIEADALALLDPHDAMGHRRRRPASRTAQQRRWPDRRARRSCGGRRFGLGRPGAGGRCPGGGSTGARAGSGRRLADLDPRPGRSG